MGACLCGAGIFALLLLCSPPAECSPWVTLGQPATAGGEVTVPVVFVADPDEPVTALVVDLSYDGEKLANPSATPGGSGVIAEKSVMSATTVPGKARVVVYGLNATPLGSGTAAVISFRRSGASGSSIPLAYKVSASSPDGEPVTFTTCEGTIEVR